jgi:CIC family chloride channel protein
MNIKLKLDILNFRSNDRIYLTIIAILIGVLTGFGAVGVHHLIHFFSKLFYGEGSLVASLQHTPAWKIILYPAGAGLLVGPMIYLFAREAKGHGVPEIIDAILLRGGRIKPIVAVVKALSASLSIGAGGSIGSEGPQAQIGATISSFLGRVFIKKEEYVKVLVAAGAGAGIAAAFNTPMAGALFASEVILGSFSVMSFSPIIMASVAATLVSEHFLGDRIVFHIPSYTIASPYEFLFHIILGIIAGFVALMFIWTLYYSEDFFDKKLKAIPEYFRPVLGGLMLGSIGIFVPYIMGSGFDTMTLMMSGKFSIGFVLLLLFLKLLATNITLGSGHSGGVFAPSLFLGAALGVFFGTLVNTYTSVNIPLEIWAVLSMSAVVAGATQAPITAMMIIFEMSKNYSLMLPLMTVAIISSLITMIIKRESIYTQKLMLRGVLLRSKDDNDQVKSKRVGEYIKKNFKYYTEGEKINKILLDLLHQDQNIFPIVDNDENKKLVGVLSMDSLKFIFEEDFSPMTQELMVAKDLMKTIESIRIDADIITALEIFEKSDYSILPIVDEHDKLMGLLSEHRILRVYNNEYRKNEIARIMLKNQDAKHGVDGIPIGNSMYITEITPPKESISKTLKDIKFRNNYDLEIVLIKKLDQSKIFPKGDYILEKDDRLMVLGSAENLRKFKVATQITKI